MYVHPIEDHIIKQMHIIKSAQEMTAEDLARATGIPKSSVYFSTERNSKRNPRFNKKVKILIDSIDLFF